MKLFPDKKFTIETKLSEDEVKERLKQLFNKKRGNDFYNSFKTNKLEDGYYYGFIEGERFALYYDDPFVFFKTEGIDDNAKNNELMCKGTIIDSSDITKVSITVDTGRKSTLYRAVSFLFYIGIVLFYFKYKSDIPFVINFILPVLIIGIASASAGIRFSLKEKYFNKVKKFLITLFKVEE